MSHVTILSVRFLDGRPGHPPAGFRRVDFLRLQAFVLNQKRAKKTNSSGGQGGPPFAGQGYRTLVRNPALVYDGIQMLGGFIIWKR